MPFYLIAFLPFSVVTYPCFELFGFPGIVILSNPASIKGYIISFLVLLLLVFPSCSIIYCNDFSSIAAFKIVSAVSSGTDLGQTWDKLGTFLAQLWSCFSMASWRLYGVIFARPATSSLFIFPIVFFP